MIETTATESSATLDEATIATTPVLGRKFEDLLTLTPGVSITQGPDDDWWLDTNPPEKAVIDVAEVGNTSAASIPIALDRAYRAGRMHEGDLVVFTSFGAGLTWGATAMRWTMPGVAA